MIVEGSSDDEEELSSDDGEKMHFVSKKKH